MFFPQVVSDLYLSHPRSLSQQNITVLFSLFTSIASHSSHLNSDKLLQTKLHRACFKLHHPKPPLIHFQNESYHSFLNFLKTIITNSPLLSLQMNIESKLASVCVEIMQMYLNCASLPRDEPAPRVHWILPSEASVKEDLAARTTLIVAVLRVLSGLKKETFRAHVSMFFPMLVAMVRTEHSSREVQLVLSNVFQSCIGQIVME